MNNEMRIGIVGCGGIATAHCDGYKKAGNARIVAVYDISKTSAEKMAASTGARAAASLEEMVERDELEAVSVCTPPGAHLDNCKPFLQAGIAVLCEKPLEADARRAAKLALLARKSKSIFMTAFCHRFHPSVLELKALIEKKVLGKALFFRNIFGGYLDLAGNHRVNPRWSGGGCLIDHCAHSMDLFRFLVGDPTGVQAFAGNIMQKLPIEDFGMIHLSMDDRAFGEITASYSLKGCGNFVEWYGSKGMAVVSYWNEGFPDLKYRVEGNPQWVAVDCSKHPDRFTGEIQHFMDCVRSGRKPSVTADDGLKVNRIAEGIYRSVKQKKQVSIRL